MGELEKEAAKSGQNNPRVETVGCRVAVGLPSETLKVKARLQTPSGR